MRHLLSRPHRQRREERIYAQAASQLSEIDRAQAEALQGQYEATSCPICLESFKSSTVGSGDQPIKLLRCGHVSSTVGSGDQPIKLLRCGHVFDESCWSEWVSSGRGNVTKCTICKMDIGGPLEGSSLQSETGDSSTNLQEAPNNNDVGADDHQVVLRRFQQERNFRLVRLGRRFPRYITQSHIQRWSHFANARLKK